MRDQALTDCLNDLSDNIPHAVEMTIATVIDLVDDAAMGVCRLGPADAAPRA